MGWAEWWLIGLVVGLLGRCIYELLNLKVYRVDPWGLFVVGFVGMSVAVFMTAVALKEVFG